MVVPAQKKCPSWRQRRVAPRGNWEWQRWQDQDQGGGFVGGASVIWMEEVGDVGMGGGGSEGVLESVEERDGERGERGECGGEVLRRLEGLVGVKVVVRDTIMGY